ncbi:MAG: purine-nucleoside phosphorylase [Zestosphaera sp.]
MSETVHIRVSKKEDIAERVIIAGDPARIDLLREFLEEPRLVSSVRGYHVYTGSYKSVPVTLAVHGIGSGSAALAIEELIMLGAKVLVRLGTCGAMIKELDVGDVVMPAGASYYSGGIFYQYLGELVSQAAIPDFQLFKNLVEEIHSSGIKYLVAPIVSCDAFYTEEGFISKWVKRGAVAVDMETAILYVLGLLRNVKTASVLIVSNSLVKPSRFLLADELKSFVKRVAVSVLEALIKTPADMKQLNR